MRFAVNKRNAITFSVVALVLLTLYVVIRVSLMVVSLQNTASQLESIQSDSRSKNLALLSEDLGRAADSIAMADAAASDPLVQLASHLPILGPDIHVAMMLGSDGKLVLQAAEDVTNISNQLSKVGVGKKDLRDYSLLPAFRESLGNMNVSVQKLGSDISTVQSSNLHFGLSEKISKAQTLVTQFSDASSRITPLLQLGSLLLEQPGQKTYFVAIQNLAEARGTGGITGAYAVLDVKNGKMTLQEYGSDKDLLKLGGIDYKNYPEELRSLWGVDLSDWRDINASANVPYAAKLIADGWQQHKGQKLDGVLFIGQGTVSELSGAVGAIDIRGVSVTPQNVVDFLSKDIYAKFTSVSAKDAVVGELAKEMFSKVIAGKVKPSGFLGAAANDHTGDKLFAWSPNEELQSSFRNYGLAGELSQKFGSNITVTLNNGGGNKLDAYSSMAIKYELGTCNVDTFTGYQGRRSRVTIDLTNGAPKSGLPAYVTTRLDDYFGEPRPKGSNRELVTIYGPVGSESEAVKVNNQEEYVSIGTDTNRPVWVFDLQMLPGETKQLVLELVEPIADDNGERIDDTQSITPPVMLNAATTSFSSTGVCSVQ